MDWCGATSFDVPRRFHVAQTLWAATAAAAVLTAGLLTHPGPSAAAPSEPAAGRSTSPPARPRWSASGCPTRRRSDDLVAAGADIAARPAHHRRPGARRRRRHRRPAGRAAPPAARPPVQVIQTAVRRRAGAPQRRGTARRGRRRHAAVPAGVLVDHRRPDVPADPGGHHGHRRPGRRDHRHLDDRRRHHRLLPAVPVRGLGRVPVPRRAAAAAARRSRSRSPPTSSLGGQSRAITPAAWPDATPPPLPTGYQKDFIDAYMTPTDIRARIQRLAPAVPGPGRRASTCRTRPRATGARRRPTSATRPRRPSSSSRCKFGDQGMNGVQVRTVDPGRPNRPLRRHVPRPGADRLAGHRRRRQGDQHDRRRGRARSRARFPQRFRAFVEDGSAGPADAGRRPGPARRRAGRRRGAAAAVDGAGAADRRGPRRLAGRRAGLLAGARPGVGHPAGDAGVRRAAAGQLRAPTRRPGSCWSRSTCSSSRRSTRTARTTRSTTSTSSARTWSTTARAPQRDPRYRNSWGVDVNRNYTVGSLLRRVRRRQRQLPVRHVRGHRRAVRAGEPQRRSRWPRRTRTSSSR